MKKIILLLLVFVLGALAGLGVGKFVLFADPEPEEPELSAIDEQAAILFTLDAQTAAWSAGNIDRFMQDYWVSDELRFASGGTVNRGWQTTIERYKARYPDRDAMGTLRFTDLEVEILSKTDALVFGRWTLNREQDAPTGLFTLHMKKFDGAWKIVSDHTSSATE